MGYGTVILSVVQGFAITTMLKSWGEGDSIVTNASIGWTLLAVITLMAGTAFVMWLGEQITEKGIGQGISIIITAGIVAAAPSGVQRLFETKAKKIKKEKQKSTKKKTK